MTITSCDPRDNQILGALKQSEREQLATHLELIALSRSEVLYESNDKLQYTYFPITATVSLVCPLEDGSTVEVAMVGNEGLLGISAVMGRNETLNQAIVNVEGHAYRISVAALRSVLARSGGRRKGTLNMLMLRYAQTLLIQMSQTAACNRRHTIEQQLGCWLLSTFDRANSNSLSITQESIAYVLGVRRESITEVAKRLQEAGTINYCRGHIELKNRKQLENTACECYGVMRNESIRWAIDSKAA
jgi:CRP-like cAMP-binding protein